MLVCRLWGCGKCAAFPCLIDFAALAASVADKLQQTPPAVRRQAGKGNPNAATRKTNAAKLPPTFDASLMKLPKRLRYDDRDAVLRSGYSIFLVATSR